MTFEPIEQLYLSDPSLFKEYFAEGGVDKWRDEWIHTWADSLGTAVDPKDSPVEFSEDYEFIGKNSVRYENLDQTAKEAYHKWLIETGRVKFWPNTPGYEATDAYGFYLPFHVSRDYHGIYLVEEYCQDLAGIFEENDNGILDGYYSTLAKLFVYYHEAFHHKVEMFATRLEVVVRKRCYLSAVSALYQETKGTDDCEEEMLANIYGFTKTIDYLKRKTKLKKNQLEQVERLLLDFMRQQPPGYRMAAMHLKDKKDREDRIAELMTSFWEKVHSRTMPETVRYEQGVWSFGYFDYPLNKINGRLNFLVHRNSPLLHRISLDARYLSTREVLKKLGKIAKISQKRQGKGSHEIWVGPSGLSVSIPKKKELKVGTLGSILKQLGVEMSVYEFLRG